MLPQFWQHIIKLATEKPVPQSVGLFKFHKNGLIVHRVHLRVFVEHLLNLGLEVVKVEVEVAVEVEVKVEVKAEVEVEVEVSVEGDTYPYPYPYP